MKKHTLSILLILSLLLSLLAGCGEDKPEPAGPLFAERGQVERAPLGTLQPARDAAAVLDAMTLAGQSQTALWEDGALRPESGRSLEISAPAPDDTVITDGSYLYLLDSYGLVIFSAAGADSQLLSYTRVPRESAGWSERLYLDGDRVAVLYSVSDYGTDSEGAWYDDAEVRIVIFDTADKKAPKKLAETAVEGAWVDSRLVDGTLLLVTQRNLLSLPETGEPLLPRIRENGETLTLQPGDIYLCPDPTRKAITVAAAIRLADGRVADALGFTDGTEAVCGAGSTLYLTRTRWDETASDPYREEPYDVVDYATTARTEIKRLRLDGGLSLDGGCVIDGALPDPAALDLSGGRLRAATETDHRSFSAYTDPKHGWTNYEGRSHTNSSQLCVLDDALQLTGSLTGLNGEQGVSSCRFLGDLAWITAPDGEALYTASLADPAAPAMGASLPARGEPLLLRAFGEGRVLGLAPAENGWELVMYDVTDPAAPRELDSLTLDDPAPAGDPTARGVLFADPASGLVGLPAAGDDGNVYLLVRWTGEKWKQKGAFALEYVPANARGLLLNGLLYICSPGEVYVTDPDQMRVLATVSNAVG